MIAFVQTANRRIPSGIWERIHVWTVEFHSLRELGENFARSMTKINSFHSHPKSFHSIQEHKHHRAAAVPFPNSNSTIFFPSNVFVVRSNAHFA
jgi:hypothetical protein